MTPGNSCRFCRRGLQGPPSAPVVKCPVCGSLVPNRGAAHHEGVGSTTEELARRLHSRRTTTGEWGAVVLIMSVVLLMYPVWMPYWSALSHRVSARHEYARMYQRAYTSRMSRSASSAGRAAASRPTSTAAPATAWGESVYSERVVVGQPGQGQPGGTPSADAGRAYDVRVSEAGPCLKLQLPAGVPDKDVQAIARQKAEAWKQRQHATRVRVTGYRRGDQIEVRIQPAK